MLPSANQFDYPLNPDQIAQFPAEPRDASRLMHLCRDTGKVTHHVFRELPDLLRADDLLVFNNTKVLPARFFCRRATGGRIEGLFLRENSPGIWRVMLRGASRCRIDEKLVMEGDEGVSIRLLEKGQQGHYRIEVHPGNSAEQILGRVGITPLPPYIHRQDRQQAPEDLQRYQTIYSRKPGAVAAPTAGLHFTESLLERLGEEGIETCFVTLHVGPGTFVPVKVQDLSQHRMHSEQFELTEETARTLSGARSQGRRIVAVGTTVVRVLETLAARGGLDPGQGETDIFLYPPARFEAVDALITNFHLPRSTLLMLVSAFCSPGDTDGVPMLLDAYHQAMREGYRFYSYGDAMLIQ